MKHTIPRGNWQDSRPLPATSRTSAVDPADLALDSRILCRICERAPYALMAFVTTGGLLDRREVPMLLTDADGERDSLERIVDQAICRPCALRLEELKRSRPLLDVLVRALLREWRRTNVNGHPPPVPRIIVEMSSAVAKEHRIREEPATDDEVAAYRINCRAFEAITASPDAEIVAGSNLDDSDDADDPEAGLELTAPWDQMVLAALPTLAAGRRIGAPHWSIDQSWST